MALTVVADIVHPAAYMESLRDLGNIVWRGTRVLAVYGLTTGSSTDASTLTARALLAPGVPAINQSHPSPVPAAAGCICVGRRTQTIPETDDGVYVYADYDTIIPSFSGGIGIISVQREGALQQETVEIHPVDGQILVDPQQGAPPGATAVPGSVTGGFPLRRLVITASVPIQNMDPFESAVCSVNDGGWFNKAIGFWRFDRIADVQQLGVATLAVVCEFSTRNIRNWHEFNVRKIEAFGRNATVDKTSALAARAAPYKYGITKFPGITCVGDYPTLNFKGLFGIDHYPP